MDLSIECITFAHVNIARISGRKMAPGRPSPAANPLIYRLRVSACIRRLGHMPLLQRHHLPPSFASRALSPSHLAPISSLHLLTSFPPLSSPSRLTYPIRRPPSGFLEDSSRILTLRIQGTTGHVSSGIALDGRSCPHRLA